MHLLYFANQIAIFKVELYAEMIKCVFSEEESRNRFLTFFNQIQGNQICFISRMDVLAENNPRRVRRRLAQRLDPTRGAGGIEPGAWGCEPSSRPLGQICQSSQTIRKDPQIIKIELFSISSK